MNALMLDERDAARLDFRAPAATTRVSLKPAQSHRSSREHLVCRWQRSPEGLLTCTWTQAPGSRLASHPQWIDVSQHKEIARTPRRKHHRQGVLPWIAIVVLAASLLVTAVGLSLISGIAQAGQMSNFERSRR